MKFLQIRINNIEEIKTVIIDNLERSRHKILAVTHSLDCETCKDINTAKRCCRRLRRILTRHGKTLH